MKERSLDKEGNVDMKIGTEKYSLLQITAGNYIRLEFAEGVQGNIFT